MIYELHYSSAGDFYTLEVKDGTPYDKFTKYANISDETISRWRKITSAYYEMLREQGRVYGEATVGAPPLLQY